MFLHRSVHWHKYIKRRIALFISVFLSVSLCVSVGAKTGFSHGERTQKRIALSFDDGPHPIFTPKILKLLEEYHIKATFFMIGVNVANYPSVAQMVKEAGHEIGNHTYSHPHMKQISIEKLSEEVRKTEEIFAQNGIPKPILFRPPEGFRSAQQVASLEAAGYKTIIWSLDTHDWQGKSAAEIVSVVLGGVQGGDILLFHDYTTQKNTITALGQLIPKLLKDGYEFVAVSDLMC